jgi:membrane associated rhomboid family serine protease
LRLLNKLEAKLSKFAIKGLMKYIVLITGLVYLLTILGAGNLYLYKLMLIPELVIKGEVWRLVTYIFIPESLSNPLFAFFTLYLYYIIGTSLEHEWGSFRFNIYYFIGMLGTTIAAMITGSATATYLNLSLFLAAAKLFPNYEILLFFILPVKLKYLGWLNWAFILFSLIISPIPQKAAVIASIINYLIFFGKDIIIGRKNSSKAYINRKSFEKKMVTDSSIHKCSVCGITEKEAPLMEFRYCSKCEGNHEYCSEHLQNHEHVK